MKPMFIVFEGLDGSGTTTQSRMLVDYLRAKDAARVHLTSEPSAGPVGQMIRTALSGRLQFTANDEGFDRQMAYLFAADRHDHLHNDTNGVLILKARGDHIVSTRYYFSSYAYHCRHPDDFDFVHSLNAAFPPPDAVIYIDIPVATSSARLSERTHLDRYENEDKLTLVRNNYERSLGYFDGPLLRVSGQDNPDHIHASIVAFIEGLHERD